MRYKLFLIIIFVFLSNYSQEKNDKNFKLNWHEGKKFVLNKTENVILPYIEKNHVDLENKIPVFMEVWKMPMHVGIKNFQITNVSSQIVNETFLQGININNISNSIEIQFDTRTTGNDLNEAFLKIIPLFKDGNVIKRLNSFTLTYETESKSQRGIKIITNSVLSSGKWYKIEVDTTGVFKIDKKFLNDLGISTNKIDPLKIQVFGNGGALLPVKIGDFRYEDLQENAIYVYGESDGKFDSNDFILFYAKGPESWKHQNTPASLVHKHNIYSDKAYYFLRIGSENGLRINDKAPIIGTPTVTFDNFDDFWYHEKDLINFEFVGQRWYGENFNVNNVQTFSHEFENLDTSTPVRIKTSVAGSFESNSEFSIKANSLDIYTIGFSHSDSPQRSEKSGIAQLDTDLVNVQITYNNNGHIGSKGYLDFVEMIAKRKLIATDKQFSFRNFSSLTETGIIAYKLTKKQKINQLWDVTDPIKPVRILNESSDDTFTFNAFGNRLNEYVVIAENDFLIPKKPTDFEVPNQNLHSISEVDYLIISNEKYLEEAQELADFHTNQRGIVTKVISLDQIYNEFASGSPDITAIRDFVRHVYFNSNFRLKYLLMYGDTSVDFKGILTNYDPLIVPAFQSVESFSMTSSFVTDDYFVIVSDLNEGDLENQASFQTLDLAVGRLPFTNSNEARAMNNKIMNYYKENSFSDYRNKILMVADDMDQDSDSMIFLQENIAENINTVKPLINIKKVWMDAYQQIATSGGSRYPTVNEVINNEIENGLLMFNYFGHGGEDGLSAERIVETAQIENWKNLDKLNLFTVISCEFARLDNPNRANTAGELIMRNPNGAAMHEIATARAIFIHVGEDINTTLMNTLMDVNNQGYSISEALRITKNIDLQSQRFFIFSLGDPSMALALPRPDIKMTHLNGIPVTQSLDTIKALSKIKIDGVIQLPNGQTDTNFNGEVYLNVYDKEQEKQTLQNDINAELVTFNTRDSKIFRGKSSVTNGEFQFEFVVPKDIRIAYGNGKLSFYAENNIEDKGGYDLNIVVGGINSEAPEDTIGPEIKLFMNDKSFIDGGSTNQSPLLLAYLQDENGINTSLSAVDHDITAILDGDEQNPIILNDYYITDLNDYQKGSLEYRLNDLSVGHHKLKLIAYDTYNNSSEATLDFIVIDDAKLLLQHVLNYPNPFVNYTEFWFNHNKPNEELEVQIQIFTVSGKLVKSFNKTIQNTGSLSRDITWDGLDDYGKKIGKGVYVYKLKVKTQNNLKAEKFEKLVILQ